MVLDRPCLSSVTCGGGIPSKKIIPTWQTVQAFPWANRPGGDDPVMVGKLKSEGQFGGGGKEGLLGGKVYAVSEQ